jgi:predicted  nucleic acid-binding Zn ribbon protein
MSLINSFVVEKMDSYNKLRPWTEIESCECIAVSTLLLIDLLSDNPIHCGLCRREVDPERISLSSTETESIARWFSSSRALYRLWLNSGEYENYAKARLLDPNGQINREGRQIAKQLSTKIPTLMWFFHDTDDGEPISCPICCNLLDTDVKWGAGQCKTCNIHM